MKNYPLLLFLPLLLFSCAGTEDYATTDNTGSQQEETTTDANLQQQNDALTESETTVSAENQPGRELNIVALAQYNPNLSTFFEMIRNAGLTVELESPGPLTVFVPTNEAFNSLPQGTLEILKDPANRTELVRIIESHILPSKVMAAELKKGTSFQTSLGENVKVAVSNGALIVGDARVIEEDIKASNGVVHIIDRVLIPPKQ